MHMRFVGITCLVLSSIRAAQCFFEVPAYKVESSAVESACNGTAEDLRLITNCEIPSRGGEKCCGIYAVNTIDYDRGAFCPSFSMRCQHPSAAVACYLFSTSSAASEWIQGSSKTPKNGSYIAGCAAPRDCRAFGVLNDARSAAPTFAISVEFLSTSFGQKSTRTTFGRQSPGYGLRIWKFQPIIFQHGLSADFHW